MKKSYVVAAVAFLLSIPAYPQAKSCDELKSEIAKKIEANGVTSCYRDPAEPTTSVVVIKCGTGRPRPVGRSEAPLACGNTGINS